jgi:uncharacterized membrane protein YbaN (DUF454 family)
MKKLFWKLLGFLSLGLAYIGVVTPGIPWSIFVVFSAYCFAKGSPKMHAWIYGHPKFGPFLTNWTEKKVFPRKLKYLMIATMSTSLAFLYFTAPLTAVLWSGGFMVLVAIWAWRYPDTVEQFEQRQADGKKVGWLK